MIVVTVVADALVLLVLLIIKRKIRSDTALYSSKIVKARENSPKFKVLKKEKKYDRKIANFEHKT